MADRGDTIISRVALILDAFDRETSTLTLTELAHRTGLPMATAYRFVEEMALYGLLHRGEDKRIRIGIRLWELSARATQELVLRDAALPHMEWLQAQARAMVTLAVMDGRDAVYLERLVHAQTSLKAGRPADRMPLHASSGGLVLLAYTSFERFERYLRGPLVKRTPFTPASPDEIRTVVASIRERSVCVAANIGTVGWSAMSVPVFNGAAKEAVAALTIVYTEGDARIQKDLPMLAGAARQLSETVGKVLADRREV